MNTFTYPKYPTANGYMTEIARHKYIEAAIARQILPKEAHRMPQIISLEASSDMGKPIQFWQLFSVLGQQQIIAIVSDFYQRVFRDEDWFTSVFARVGGVNHHINTQGGMWLDVMGAGPAYNGGEFRLHFHHTHNAFQLMNEKGANRWAKLMVETLDATAHHMGGDPRVRPGINTFLTHFFAQYASDFSFEIRESFGPTNPPMRRKINFLNMTEAEIEALSEAELKQALIDRGIDVIQLADKSAMVRRALSL